MATPPSPAPTPIPAFAPVESPEEGCTGNWIAYTIFTTADVGVGLTFGVKELVAALVKLPVAAACCE